MNAVEILRTAARAISCGADCARPGAHALAGLFRNRADDMELNIALWQRAGQDVPALVNQHYGVYLAVAVAVLVGLSRGDDARGASG